MKPLTPAILLFLLFTFPSQAQNNCFECHGQRDFMGETDDGQERSLYVDQERYHASSHGEFQCRDCHHDAKGDPHPEKLSAVDCTGCHEEAAIEFSEGVHGRLLMSGAANAPTCSSCHTTHEIKSAADTTSSVHAMNVPQTCERCHLQSKITDIPTGDQGAKHYNQGVHAKALAEGNDLAASCDDCHDSHRILPKSDPNSKIFRFNISKTCGQCHDDIAAEYDASIHRVGVKEGEFSSATCINCHEAHRALSASDPDSPTHPLNAPDQLCASCHAAGLLNKRPGLSENLFDSYKDSYHGLANSRGSAVAANCNSCHGIHDIRSKTDPKSSVHAANVQKTCAQCHFKVTEAFASSYTHGKLGSLEQKISSIVRVIYIYLIILVIGGMVVHNLIIWFAYVRVKYRAHKKEKTIARFDTAWVIQHIIVFISFTILVITGFALKFPQMSWVKLLMNLGLTENLRAILHRSAAIGLLGGGLYHLWCLFFVRRWHGELKELTLRLSDFRHFYQNMRYHLGLDAERPLFERYGYVEKAEYWALVWGTVMMAITGFILWFPTIATRFMPPWIIKVSETIHFYEAVLATLAIVLYHMFFAIFHPANYPLNLTGFTGKISEEEVKERFPMWYQKLKLKDQEPPAEE